MPTDNPVSSVTRIAIITGGSRGLGRSTVLSLAQRGVDSIFTYKSNRAKAETVVGLVAELGRKAKNYSRKSGRMGHHSVAADLGTGEADRRTNL
jgi:NAD(P)-dependent dehydrogenase (short-subunit alcohol dehydrogenase family)